MKAILTALVLMLPALGFADLSSVGPSVLTSSGTKTTAPGDGADFNAIVGRLPSSVKLLVVDTSVNLTASTTTPTSLQIYVRSGAINQTGSFTLTIGGSLTAENRQVFYGFSPAQILDINQPHVEWFGAKGDTVLSNGSFVSGTDSTNAFQCAIAASSSSAVVIGDGAFKITGTLTENRQAGSVLSGLHLKGDGFSSVLVNVAAANTPTIKIDGTHGAIIEDLAGTGVKTATNTFIDVNGASDWLIRNVSGDPMGTCINVHGTNVQTGMIDNAFCWWNVYGWGTYDIRTQSRLSLFDGVHIHSGSAEFANQISIDKFRCEGGANGIFEDQVTLGDSAGLFIKNYVNANTSRGVYVSTVANISIENWYPSNSGDYIGYFYDTRYVTLKNVFGGFGSYLASMSLGFAGTNFANLAIKNAYIQGDIWLESSLTSATRPDLAGVDVIGNFRGLQPSTFVPARYSAVSDATGVIYNGFTTGAGTLLDNSTFYAQVQQITVKNSTNGGAPSVSSDANMYAKFYSPNNDTAILFGGYTYQGGANNTAWLQTKDDRNNGNAGNLAVNPAGGWATFGGSTSSATFTTNGTTSLHSGLTEMKYCSGGTFDGNICRGAACICTGGSAVGLGVYVP